MFMCVSETRRLEYNRLILSRNSLAIIEIKQLFAYKCLHSVSKGLDLEQALMELAEINSN